MNNRPAPRRRPGNRAPIMTSASGSSSGKGSRAMRGRVPRRVCWTLEARRILPYCSGGSIGIIPRDA